MNCHLTVCHGHATDMNVHPTYDRAPLTQNLRHDSWQFEARQTFFQSAAGEEQLLMVQPQQMQNRGVEVMDADRMLNHAVAKVVCCAVTGSAADSAARHP